MVRQREAFRTKFRHFSYYPLTDVAIVQTTELTLHTSASMCVVSLRMRVWQCARGARAGGQPGCMFDDTIIDGSTRRRETKEHLKSDGLSISTPK